MPLNMTSIDSVRNATLGFRSIFYMLSAKELADNQQDIIAHSYTWFIVLMVVEFIVGRMRGHKTYRLNDGIMSILLGMTSEQYKIWGKAGIFYLYEKFHARFGIVVFDKNTSLASFVFAMVMVDFFYYWFHRFCHEFHFAFTQHSVHHSGEDYNLATALRQGGFQWLIGFAFTLPLALIIPPPALFGHFFVNTLAQFWFHTSQIGELDFLEYVINTPAAHRMHHRPPGNCNYGGVLIVFDKVFGTYVPEREHLDYYGLAKQYDSFDPVWASVEHGVRVVSNVDNGTKSMSSLLRRRVKHRMVFDLSALFRPIPKPEKTPWVLPTQPHRTKLDPQLPLILNVYILALFLLQLFSFFKMSDAIRDGSLNLGVELAIRQVLSLTAFSSIGRLFDGFSKGRSLNMARCLLSPLIIAWTLDSKSGDAWMYYASLMDLTSFFLVSMHLVGSKH